MDSGHLESWGGSAGRGRLPRGGQTGALKAEHDLAHSEGAQAGHQATCVCLSVPFTACTPSFPNTHHGSSYLLACISQTGHPHYHLCTSLDPSQVSILLCTPSVRPSPTLPYRLSDLGSDAAPGYLPNCLDPLCPPTQPRMCYTGHRQDFHGILVKGFTERKSKLSQSLEKTAF